MNASRHDDSINNNRMVIVIIQMEILLFLALGIRFPILNTDLFGAFKCWLWTGFSLYLDYLHIADGIVLQVRVLVVQPYVTWYELLENRVYEIK